MKNGPLFFSLGLITCFTHGLEAAEAASNPEDILFAATRQFLTAPNYSWTLREGEEDHLRIRRKRPHIEGKTQINGFSLFSMPGWRDVRTEAAALGKETVYKVGPEWRFYSDLDQDNRSRVAGRIQLSADHLRPLPHEVLSFALGWARNIRKDANDVVAEVATGFPATNIQGYVTRGRPLPQPGDHVYHLLRKMTSADDRIELRVGIAAGRVVEFTLDFDPLQTGVKRSGLSATRLFWEITDIGSTSLQFEPGVDVMLKTLQGLVSAPGR